MFTTTIKSIKSLEVSENWYNKTYLIIVEEILLSSLEGRTILRTIGNKIFLDNVKRMLSI